MYKPQPQWKMGKKKYKPRLIMARVRYIVLALVLARTIWAQMRGVSSLHTKRKLLLYYVLTYAQTYFDLLTLCSLTFFYLSSFLDSQKVVTAIFKKSYYASCFTFVHYANSKLWNYIALCKLDTATSCIRQSFSDFYGWIHGLRTPNEGINQRNLKFWADVADKICFGRT